MLVKEISVFQFHPNYLGLSEGLGLTAQRMKERKEHLKEEFKELHSALDCEDYFEVADAYGDIYYIAIGTLLEAGFSVNWIEKKLAEEKALNSKETLNLTTEELESYSLGNILDFYNYLIKLANASLDHLKSLGIENVQGVIEAIHKANLQRVRGTSKRGHSIDMIKPEGWQAPDLMPFINKRKVSWATNPYEKKEKLVDHRRELYGSFSERGLFVDRLEDIASEHIGFQELDGACRHALRMIFEKVGRIVTSPHPHYQDNWEDIKGYAELALEAINEFNLDEETKKLIGNKNG